MASKAQMTGMLGTYLGAAELTRQGLVVSITSRNARGADLLATDPSYKRTWSVQVKTNGAPARYWLLSADYRSLTSPTHIYLFINLRGDDRPEYYVVPSRAVARHGNVWERPNSTWYGFSRSDAEPYRDRWSILDTPRRSRSKTLDA